MKPLPQYNVLLLMNRSAWVKSKLFSELAAIRDFYAQGDGVNKAIVTFHILDTAVEDIKWVDAKIDSTTGQSTDKLIDREFYDKNFVRPALRWGWKTQIPVDILCVVLPEWQIETRTTRGACDWGGSNAGMVECWIAGDVNDKYRFNGTPVVSGLQANLAHELKHAMHFFNKTPDTTHRLLNKEYGNYPLATDLSGIRVTADYTENKTVTRYWRNYFRQLWSLFT